MMMTSLDVRGTGLRTKVIKTPDETRDPDESRVPGCPYCPPWMTITSGEKNSRGNPCTTRGEKKSREKHEVLVCVLSFGSV